MEETIFSGSASIVEVQNVVAGGSGPVEFLGGPEAESGTGLAIEFGTESNLIVTVDPTPSFAEAELILVNLFAQNTVAWDINVEGELTSESTIYIPFDFTGIDIPSVAFVVYHFDEILGEWELLDATFDVEAGLITATTDNFSPVFAGVVESPEAAQELLRQLNSVAVPLPSTMLLALVGLLLMRKFRARLA